MARKKAGIAFVQRGVTYTGIRTREGKRVSWPVSRDTPPPEGTDALQWARLVSLQYQALYDTGKWEPGQKPQETAPSTVPTFGAYLLGWIAKQTYQSAPRDLMLVRILAKSPVAEVPITELRPKHGVELSEWLKRRPSKRGGTFAPKTVRICLGLCRRALESAITQEVLASNPLRTDAVRRATPSAADKDPGARSTWRFTQQEIDLIVSSDKITACHRVLWALAFYTGLRPGELVVLRWKDFDFTAKPMPRLTIARAQKAVSRAEGGTKTGAIKEVPLVPQLVKILEQWRGDSAPSPGALVVTNPSGTAYQAVSLSSLWPKDLDRVGLPRRHLYCTRHTFIRSLRDAGAQQEVVKWATHAPRGVYTGYSWAPPWEVLCREVAKIAVTDTVTRAVPDSRLSNDYGGLVIPSHKLRTNSTPSDTTRFPANSPPATPPIPPSQPHSVTDTVTPVTEWLRESVQSLDQSEALLSAEESLLFAVDFSRDIH